jgi:thiol:disulfide interchange protein DsbC
MSRKLTLLLALCLLPLFAFAQEDALKKTLEDRFKIPVESVTPAGYGGLYEVFAGGQIIYVDKNLSFILAGPLLDGKTMENITQKRLEKLTAIDFDQLPLEHAIKQVRGNGKRKMATFEDPNCGYCKKLARDTKNLTDVTIYIFLLPILSEDSNKKSRQIGCAEDRVKAWNDWIVDGKAPQGKRDCDTTAIDANRALANRINVMATPTLFFADGSRVSGAMPLPAIEERLGKK